MMLSTPAPHEPFTPAPQYANAFSDMKAPRNGSYNVKAVVTFFIHIIPLYFSSDLIMFYFTFYSLTISSYFTNTSAIRASFFYCHLTSTNGFAWGLIHAYVAQYFSNLPLFIIINDNKVHVYVSVFYLKTCLLAYNPILSQPAQNLLTFKIVFLVNFPRMNSVRT